VRFLLISSAPSQQDNPINQNGGGSPQSSRAAVLRRAAPKVNKLRKLHRGSTRRGALLQRHSTSNKQPNKRELNMQNKQDKKKKPIKVRDLKASKDAKGGVRTDVSVSGTALTGG
jgi:hypothetical protein